MESATEKYEAVMKSLCGSPKDTLDMPSEVLHPSSFLIFSSAPSVTLAAFESADTAVASVSKISLFLPMPYFAA